MRGEELQRTIWRMQKYGGSFVQGLSALCTRADEINLLKLQDAFPELFQKYGDSGDFAEKQESHDENQLTFAD